MSRAIRVICRRGTAAGGSGRGAEMNEVYAGNTRDAMDAATRRGEMQSRGGGVGVWSMYSGGMNE